MGELELSAEVSPSLLAEIKERLPYVCGVIEAVDVDPRRPRVLRFRVSPVGLEVEAREQLAALVSGMVPGRRDLPVERIFEHHPGRSRFFPAAEGLRIRGELTEYGPGQVGFGGVAVKVLQYFDAVFAEWARDLGAVEARYPSLLPLELLSRAGYPADFPQHLTLATHIAPSLESLRRFSENPAQPKLGDVAPPAYALAPAVCYACYAAWQDKVLTTDPFVVSAAGRCFRYESAHLQGLARLWDFSMREIIVLGSHVEVERIRRQLVNRAARYVTDLGLDGLIQTASDPFFTSSSEGKRVLQRLQSLKYELNLRLDEAGDMLAVASFNHHVDFFGQRFGIRLPDGGGAHSGCTAFGLERWVLAFLSQYGLEPVGWPEPLQRFCVGG